MIIPNDFAAFAIFCPILPMPKIPNLVPVNCFPIKRSADHVQPPSLAFSIPSETLLQAPSINHIPISAVASVKKSGVLVTSNPLLFATS